jgi:hypothetical protein
MQVMIERLNQAPSKNLLAFLDMMGISLIPSKPARAPVVFRPAPSARDGRIEAGTRLGASVPGVPGPMVFETESAIAMAAAKLVEVVSLWPARDQFADHSSDFAGGRPFTTFKPAQPVQHELYFAHKTLLAFAGMATVEVEFELSTSGSAPLSISWEAWDGQAWRQFGVQDGTVGLTRSGVVTLSAECGDSVKTTIDGISSFWIHGTLDHPFPPDPARVLAMADRIRLRTGIDRPLQGQKDQPYTGAIKPDQAFANGNQLDLSATFFPFGKSPDDRSIFYLSSEEVFSKPGASVNVGFTRIKTPDEEATEQEAEYERKAEAATSLLEAAVAAVRQTEADARRVDSDVKSLNVGEDVLVSSYQDDVTKAGPLQIVSADPSHGPADFPPAKDLLDNLKNQQKDVDSIRSAFKGLQKGVEAARADADIAASDAKAALDAVNKLNPNNLLVAVGVPSSDPAKKLLEIAVAKVMQTEADVRQVDNDLKSITVDDGHVETVLKPYQDDVMTAVSLKFPFNPDPLLFPHTDEFINKLKLQGQDVNNIRSLFQNAQRDVGTARAASDAKAALDAVSNLSPKTLLDAAGIPSPELSAAKLVWEYWNGRDWQTLIPLEDSTAACSFTSAFGTANFSCKVPDDFEPTEVNGINARWVRARIAEGSYNHLRLVSWVDSAGNINFSPILEPRPPALRALFLGYSYRSKWETPEECLTKNDFQFEYHGLDVRAPGSFFPPFKPVADALPALYLGFDRPLPNDLVSLYFDAQEAGSPTPPLVWEAWDGTAWHALSVTDGTAGLAQPGVVSFIPPEVAPRPTVAVSQASGISILTNSAADAAVFRPGNQVVIQQENAVEVATVREISDAVILLQTPLSATYSGGSVSVSLLPRFGSSRDWIRARLKQEGDPARSRISGVFTNAAWASQVRTVAGEVLGSGTAQPSQTVFLSQAPVLPEEQIEVRELEGARAHVEFPILQDEFRKRGLDETLIRTVSDPRSGHITEVWVRWQSKPHLFFSNPDDRHYVIERARGRVIFGDGKNGRIPTTGANNIRAARYQTIDGLAGNVPAGKITQLLGIAPLVQSVTNPRAADGGAEGEKLDDVFIRGPQVMRHQGRSLAARDYEALAREASPAVANVKAMPATAPNLRPAPGWVTVTVVPQSADSQPQPPQELRREVHDFLAARVPATVCASHVSVIGPTYLPLGVRALVSPVRADEAGAVKTRVLSAVRTFLQPVTGGPEGRGWAFGRDVFLSDVARLLKAVEGVDYVRNLELLVESVVVGERAPVPPNRIVAAGPVQIEMELGGASSCHCH